MNQSELSKKLFAWIESKQRQLDAFIQGESFALVGDDKELVAIDPERVSAAICSRCSAAIGNDKGPPDGWQLEDGSTVCHACCVADTRQQLLGRE